MNRSISQGLAHLDADRSKVIFDVTANWNVRAATLSAEKLEEAIDKGIYMSGPVLNFAVRDTLKLATSELGGRITYVDSEGGTVPSRPGDMTIPKGASRLVLTFD